MNASETYDRNSQFQIEQFKRNVDAIYKQDSIHILKKLQREFGIYSIACSRRPEMIAAAKRIIEDNELKFAEKVKEFDTDILEWLSTI